MSANRVLVVDDSEEIAELVAAVLAVNGYETRMAFTGSEALAVTREWGPDVIILDLTLPDVDGIEVCRQVRTFSSAYVLMLTARSDEIDRVVGLTVGADDYVTKPFSSRELTARVSALMRRPRIDAPQELIDEGKRTLGRLILDTQLREVCYADRVIELTKIEFDILDALTQHSKRVLTRGELRERGWGAASLGDDHAVDVHVSNLRKKLSSAGAPSVIMTVRGIGYRLAPELLTEPG